MEAFELLKLINSIDSILLQDVSTIKTISSTEMWSPIYVCNLDKFVPLSAKHHMVLVNVIHVLLVFVIFYHQKTLHFARTTFHYTRNLEY